LAKALRGAGYRVLWQVPGHYEHVHVETAGVEPRGLMAALDVVPAVASD
jgi:hypothetical protein